MKKSAAPLLAGALVIASCGERTAHVDPQYAIVARIAARGAGAGDALAKQVRRNDATAAIVVDGLSLAEATTFLAPVLANDPATKPRIVVIDPSAAAPADLGVADAVVAGQTGAAAAFDLAVLTASGIDVPKEIRLGTRVYTRTGTGTAITETSRHAAGDLVIELLRRQHANVLAVTPATDAIVRVGFLQFRTDDSWQVRVAAEVAAAAKQNPRVALSARIAGGSAEEQGRIVQGFLAEGCRAIVVATDDPASLAPMAAAIREQHVALIAIDRLLRGEHVTCCIGADQDVVGRAAAETIVRLLPAGAAIVDLHGDPASPIHTLRHRGFADALTAK